MKNNIAIGVSVVAVIVAAFFGLSSKPGSTVYERLAGGPAGADINSPFLNVNGVYSEFRNAKTTGIGGVGSTTVCAIPVPAGTSTLVSFTMQVSSTTGTAINMDIGTSTTPYSTTTVPMILKSGAATPFAAGTFPTIVFNGIGSSSPAYGTLQAQDTFGVSTNVLNGTSTIAGIGLPVYLVAKTGAASLIGGVCKAEFRMVVDPTGN